jgi:hypothetical protein
VKSGIRVASSIPNGRCPPTHTFANRALSSFSAKTRSARAPGALIVGNLWRELALQGEIGHADPASGLEQPEHLRERSTLPSRQVQDAVGDHHIDRLVRKRYVFHLSPDELGPARDARLGRVATSSLAHLLKDVESDGLPLGSDAVGGEDRVDPSARAHVENGLALQEKGIAHGVPDRERPPDCPGRDLGELVVRVEAAGHRIAAAGRDRRIRLPDGVLDLLLEHEVLGHRSS